MSLHMITDAFYQPKGITWESCDTGLLMDHTHAFSKLNHFTVTDSAVDYRHDNSVWMQKFRNYCEYELFLNEKRKKVKGKKNDCKSETVNGFHDTLELVSYNHVPPCIQSPSLLTTLGIGEFGHDVKEETAMEDLGSEDKDSTFLEPSSGDTDCLAIKFTGKTKELVVKSRFSECVGNVLNFSSRMEGKMLKELLSTEYSGYLRITILSAVLRKTVVSQSTLKKLERCLWNFFTFPDKENGTICKLKSPYDRLKMLAQVLTCFGYDNRFLLSAIKSLLCQVYGIKICNAKLLEKSRVTDPKLSLSSDVHDPKCKKKTYIKNCIPGTDNVNVETSSFDGSLFTTNEYDANAKFWERKVGNLISEDFSKVDESKCQPLLSDLPNTWSDNCRKYGRGVMGPDKNRCLVFEKDTCSVSDTYLPKSDEKMQQTAACPKNWYDNNSLYVSRSRRDGTCILYKRYYNSTTGYTQIFCNNCGKVCRENDFGSKEKMIGKQLSHECETYSDIPVSIPRSPWMKKWDSWNKSFKSKASQYEAGMWSSKDKLS